MSAMVCNRNDRNHFAILPSIRLHLISISLWLVDWRVIWSIECLSFAFYSLFCVTWFLSPTTTKPKHQKMIEALIVLPCRIILCTFFELNWKLAQYNLSSTFASFIHSMYTCCVEHLCYYFFYSLYICVLLWIYTRGKSIQVLIPTRMH